MARSIDDGTVVSYTTWQGSHLTLTSYQGKYVEVLLPASWVAGLTQEERRTLIDRSDLLYERYKELVGVEPGGTGLLPIAMVDATCGWGCGYVGAKGIEIADDAGSLSTLKGELSKGFSNGVLVHEMCHNFDVFAAYLHYLPDHAHAWTDFLNAYMFTYDREGTPDQAPAEALQNYIDQYFTPYTSQPTANWQQCVRDSGCTTKTDTRL